MSESEQVLKLPLPDGKDELGGYYQGRLDSSFGEKIATYIWKPPIDVAEAKAVVFLVHGVLSHSTFEWLAADEDNHRVLLRGSVIESLLQGGCVVIAHDHPGHGRTTGLHAYVESHDEMRDTAIEVVNHFMAWESLAGKKTAMMGLSMGGTVAIRIAQKCPDLIQAYALISPAVRPPDDMFGWYGRFLNSLSSLLGVFVPKLPVLKLPPSSDENIRDAVAKDGLVHKGSLRVRMCLEFLRVYAEINDNAQSINFKSVAFFVGALDNIVSPSGIKSFVERIQSDDKEMFVFDNIYHDVLRETNSQQACEQCTQWLLDRI